jgi:hypothetical protein
MHCPVALVLPLQVQSPLAQTMTLIGLSLLTTGK